MQMRLAFAVMLGAFSAVDAGEHKVYTQWPFDTAEAKRRQTETAKVLGVKIERDIEIAPGVKMRLVLIPAGEFMMGSAVSADEVARLGWWHPAAKMGRIYKNEHPQHRVRLTQPFWMGKYEVTVEQFRAFVETTRYKTDSEKSFRTFGYRDGKFGSYEGMNWTNAMPGQTDSHPATCMTWNDAAAFCKWLSWKIGSTCKLPSEAQWEYACRSGTSTPFYFGDTIATEQANYDGNSAYGNGRRGINRRKTAPVGSFPQNAWGLHDMHGNVSEWCNDPYDENYYKASPTSDPGGGVGDYYRVMRGGGWRDPARATRSASRWGNQLSNEFPRNGFRVVLPTGHESRLYAAVRPATTASGQWMSLFDGKTLDGWRVARQGFFKNWGDVKVVQGSVILDAGRPGTGVALARRMPTDGYEFSVEAARLGGQAGFCSIFFPVGTSQCTLAVGGFGGSTLGLQTVDGRGADKNPTTQKVDFQRGQWYQVRLRVTKKKIEAWIDDVQMFSIERAGHKFGVFGGYESLTPLGIFSWTTKAALRDMRMRTLEPTDVPILPVKPGAPTGQWKVYTQWPFDAVEAKRRQVDTARALGVTTEEDIDLGKGIQLNMVLIPAGEFMMGSPEKPTPEGLSKLYVQKADYYECEFPQHRVRITKPFWLGRLEVTQAQWQEVMGENPSHYRGAVFPVEMVSWNNCQSFLTKLNGKVAGRGFRLPTEAQWEYACRAGTANQFHFGSAKADLGDYAWWSRNAKWRTHPVGDKRPNAWGLHDIQGNVREWCADPYDKNYYKNSPQEDPRGPAGAARRVIRGGSAQDDADVFRSAYRYQSTAFYRSQYIGFRISRPIP